MTAVNTLIIGGGFSGLAAGITLSRTGHRVELVERAPSWPADGAGISIGSASIRALRELGVLDEFRAAGYSNDGTQIRSQGGHVIADIPAPRLAGPDVPSNGAIMRPLLSEILVRAALDAGLVARLGVTADGIADEGDAVAVDFSDGTTGRYDLVVAADGLRSVTRARVFPEAPQPAFSGQGVYRAIVPRPADVVQTTIWVGGPAKVGVNPVSEERMYLFVNESKSASDRVGADEALGRVKSLVAHIADPTFETARDGLDENSLVVYRPMENLILPLPWHRGRVVLIGDAVHATTPHLASGAGIGIEDAIVLAEELTAAATIEEGLTAFEARRFERCRMVVENSARLGLLESREGTEQEFAELQAESFRLLAEPI
jgi:2-polyprenyl-6-methoxyphenol hydroxylase-like FAD-dependent oxidoreductase